MTFSLSLSLFLSPRFSCYCVYCVLTPFGTLFLRLFYNFDIFNFASLSTHTHTLRLALFMPVCCFVCCCFCALRDVAVAAASDCVDSLRRWLESQSPQSAVVTSSRCGITYFIHNGTPVRLPAHTHSPHPTPPHRKWTPRPLQSKPKVH